MVDQVWWFGRHGRTHGLCTSVPDSSLPRCKGHRNGVGGYRTRRAFPNIITVEVMFKGPSTGRSAGRSIDSRSRVSRGTQDWPFDSNHSSVGDLESLDLGLSTRPSLRFGRLKAIRCEKNCRPQAMSPSTNSGPRASREARKGCHLMMVTLFASNGSPGRTPLDKLGVNSP